MLSGLNASWRRSAEQPCPFLFVGWRSDWFTHGTGKRISRPRNVDDRACGNGEQRVLDQSTSLTTERRCAVQSASMPGHTIWRDCAHTRDSARQTSAGRGDRALTNRRLDAPRQRFQPNAMFISRPPFSVSSREGGGHGLDERPQLSCSVTLLDKGVCSCLHWMSSVKETVSTTDHPLVIDWFERQHEEESGWPQNTHMRKTVQRSRDGTLSLAESR